MCHISYNFICYFVARGLYIIAMLHRCVLLYLATLIVSCVIANAAEDPRPNNHFGATNNRTTQPAQQSQSLDPLKDYPLKRYTVHGVIVMENDAVAIVKTPQNTWHKLRVRSYLGQQQARVHQITTQGIQVEIQGTLQWLPVLQ